jgi:hypothetical protein
MSAMGPSGSKFARRDKRVRRVHIARGERTICNRPKTQGDVEVTPKGDLPKPLPSNLCIQCRARWFQGNA